jgi:hypothetical protein
MKKYQKFKPYVRLANGKEHAASFRDAIRLAFYESLGKPFYVMVQRGCPNAVIGVGKSKRDLKRGPVAVWADDKTFREWAKWIQQYASKG